MEKKNLDDVLEILYPRIKFLESVCITGGEPTLHRHLPNFLYRLKTIGALVKIKSNGSRPKMIKILLDRGLLDYITIDVISPLSIYDKMTRYHVKKETIMESIQLIRKSDVKHDFRVKIIPGIIDEEEILKISKTLAGSRSLVLTPYRPGKTLSPEFDNLEAPSKRKMKKIFEIARPYFHECVISE